ncbi:L-aspartate oxidase [Niallia circulans]|uniref:L-aspartate oxidase n=1 Tax=Niallia circulans TaxID=1397 RepID=A0A553SN84_NIACI|nr:L-aspartate oxidase [Niallia circulans]TRZ38442.1 L-aspartate oxidase [Niallia circulans]
MKTDVLIIGSGIASLQLARQLASHLNVMILTKMSLVTSNSYLAQGGIAASISAKDSYEQHALDTIEAGRFHNDICAVKTVTKMAPVLLHDLAAAGCAFDQEKNGNWSLGMEGAHSENRIVHSGGDETGKKVIEFLVATMPAHVTIKEGVFVYELILSDKGSCIGAKAIMADGTKKRIIANHIIIATGGCGQIYEYTSNAATITGDGIALAYLAGANIINMEFVQFHPTLLYVDGKTVGLISEAVRGEGAVLVTDSGVPIMANIHPYKDLAPRHIVAQRIYQYWKKGESVYLDIANVENFAERFPSITAKCIQHGINLQNKKIPVAPGCHFLMGGIETDLGGKTSVDRLYAIGEAACTGLHGANRLASNSLLEGLYMGNELAKYLNETGKQKSETTQEAKPIHLQKKYKSLPSIKELQQRTMASVGIIRTEKMLQEHQLWLESYLNGEKWEVQTASSEKEERQTYFMVLTAYLVTKAALIRTESRGGHYRSDFPQEVENWRKQKVLLKMERIEGASDERNKITAAT